MTNQNAAHGADGVGNSSHTLTPSKDLDMTIGILKFPQRDLNERQMYIEHLKRFERVWWMGVLSAVTALAVIVFMSHFWPQIVGQVEVLNEMIDQE